MLFFLFLVIISGDKRWTSYIDLKGVALKKSTHLEMRMSSFFFGVLVGIMVT